jgi:hypothetical protein
MGENHALSQSALQSGLQQEFQSAIGQQHTAFEPETVQQFLQLTLTVGSVARQRSSSVSETEGITLVDPVEVTGLGRPEIMYGKSVGHAVLLQVRAQHGKKSIDGGTVEKIEQIPEQADIEARMCRKL